MGQIYYSASTSGFYKSEIHGEDIPSDSVEITQDKYTDLLVGQGVGHEIVSDQNGYPINKQPSPPSISEISAQELAVRTATADKQIAILKPAIDGGYAKPEHSVLLADWQRCRYELTLVPEQPGWPYKPKWPTEPEKVI